MEEKKLTSLFKRKQVLQRKMKCNLNLGIYINTFVFLKIYRPNYKIKSNEILCFTLTLEMKIDKYKVMLVNI